MLNTLADRVLKTHNQVIESLIIHPFLYGTINNDWNKPRSVKATISYNDNRRKTTLAKHTVYTANNIIHLLNIFADKSWVGVSSDFCIVVNTHKNCQYFYMYNGKPLLLFCCRARTDHYLCYVDKYFKQVIFTDSSIMYYNEQ